MLRWNNTHNCVQLSEFPWMLTAIRNLVTRHKAKILKQNGSDDCRLLTTSYTLKVLNLSACSALVD